ncbi:hypothetical protein COV87_03305 [Candidatus Roizmanbacteria bacterium CG11_big_fil_rev_8_21_14_0_20_37_16]|uniref:Mannosyl-glycoprotein endo-beta-N-acetylglucosamidase-like domain-containing protein n=2 Tax=Candidatus Roizmaniibacteriota TaxID=1752723 RepID=A0A2H0KJN9_9BACT|nr:MAG: hypothetical protein COV87_03305 [Candidatus Roizmanbacteria bacterium CG11_big_fil_rev_8_21_14_0_20_37_16]
MRIRKLIQKSFLLIFVYVLVVFVAFGIGIKLSAMNRQLAYYRKVMDDLELISLLSLEQGKSQTEILTEFKTADIRIANLKYFFRKYDSVLYDQSDYIVKMADQYTLDYRLIPAIAMQESGLCKHIYEGSHNCWGWGIYGNKVTRFDSYEEAIETISRGIKKNYIDKGLTTPEAIMRKYTPPSDGSWAFGVNTFLKMIE